MCSHTASGTRYRSDIPRAARGLSVASAARERTARGRAERTRAPRARSRGDRRAPDRRCHRTHRYAPSTLLLRAGCGELLRRVRPFELELADAHGVAFL